MSTTDLKNVKRMAEILGATLTLKMENGEEINGKLERTNMIDKQFYLFIKRTKADGGDIHVKFSSVDSFQATDIPKKAEKKPFANLPCKGKQNIEGCKFPMQQFERRCQTCTFKMTQFLAPEKIKK